MAAEQDAEEIEGLALEPVRSAPDIDHGIDHRLRAAGVGLDPQAAVVVERQQVVDHREALRIVVVELEVAIHAAPEAGGGGVRGVPLGLAVGGVVDAAEVDELLEGSAESSAARRRPP
jgi:hypothetical protein